MPTMRASDGENAALAAFRDSEDQPPATNRDCLYTGDTRLGTDRRHSAAVCKT